MIMQLSLDLRFVEYFSGYKQNSLVIVHKSQVEQERSSSSPPSCPCPNIQDLDHHHHHHHAHIRIYRTLHLALYCAVFNNDIIRRQLIDIKTHTTQNSECQKVKIIRTKITCHCNSLPNILLITMKVVFAITLSKNNIFIHTISQNYQCWLLFLFEFAREGLNLLSTYHSPFTRPALDPRG